MRKLLLLGTLLTAGAVSAHAQTYPSPTFNTLTLQNPLAIADGGTGSTSGGGGLTPIAANQVLGSLTAVTPTGLTVPSCSGSNNALSWTSGTGFGCNTISTSGSPGGATSNVQFNSSSAFTGNGGFTYNGNGAVTLGISGTSAGTINLSNTTSGSITLTPPTGALGSVTDTLPLGGTLLNNTTGAGAGVNTNITSITGLTTPLSIAQGGTGATSGSAAISALGGATSGANTNITSLFTPATGFFAQNHGANITRINDRLFVGPATVNDGDSPNVVPDWFTAFQESTAGGSYASGTIAGSQSAFLSQNGGPAFLAASQTLNAAAGGGQESTFSVAAFGICNATGSGVSDSCWAYYGEGHKLSGQTGQTYGMELDVSNLGSVVTNTPYSQTAGGTVDMQLSSGAGVTGGNATTAAINIAANPNTFQAGIIINNNALSGCTGTSGSCAGIEMGLGAAEEWFSGTSLAASILSTVLTTSHIQQLQFADAGTEFTSGTSPTVATLLLPIQPASAVNGVEIEAATTTQAPVIQAQGSDTNITLQLLGKGVGGMSASGNDAMLYQNGSGQSIPNSTFTTLTGWTRNSDRLGTTFNASTGVFTAPAGGIYQVSAGLAWASSTATAASSFELAVFGNGTKLCQSVEQPTSTTAIVESNTVSCLVSLSTGQTINLEVFQNATGGNLAIGSSGQNNYLNINRVP